MTWPAQDWADLIGTGAGELRQSWPGQVGSSARPYLLAYAYLLGGFTAFDRVGRFHRQSLATRVFGKDPVDDAIGQIRGVLAGWGYHRRCERELTAVICHVLLLNRSPRLEDLSGERLARLRRSRDGTVLPRRPARRSPGRGRPRARGTSGRAEVR